MNDYLLEISVKNNILKKLMKAKGIKTAQELKRLSGVDAVRIGYALNLKIPLYNKFGDFFKVWKDLSLFFGVLPEDLLPKEHYYNSIQSNKITKEISVDEVRFVLDAPKDSETIMIVQEYCEKLYDRVDSLPPRRANILKMRYGLEPYDREYTLEEIASKYGCTRSNIGMQQQKAEVALKNKAYRSELTEIASVIY
tara:strand:- start:69 stop:656 length:588 start_codon:yes stop_codon:yes gene_type:complete